MTLIIEDGSNVSGANSYCTLTEIREYALQRGVTLTLNDSKLEVYSFKAMDYLEGKGDEYKGLRSNSDQSLSWPRMDVVIEGVDFPVDDIPQAVKNAQCRLCMDVSAGIDLLPTIEGGKFIVKETIGALSTEYSQIVGTKSLPTLNAVRSILKPVLKNGGSQLLTCFRV